MLNRVTRHFGKPQLLREEGFAGPDAVADAAAPVAPSEPWGTADALRRFEGQPATPLVATHLALASELKARRAQRVGTLERRKEEYCALMEGLQGDPLVLALQQEMIDGQAREIEYALGFGLVLNARGVEAVLDRSGRRWQAQSVRHMAPEWFVSHNHQLGGFESRDAAVPQMCIRIAEIYRDITQS